MMNFLKHTSTELLLFAVMESCAVFTPEFSLTQLIIWRSMLYLLALLLQTYLLTKYRIILACIRKQGNCPCPRCLIPLKRVQNLGQVRDMKDRQSLARADDDSRRHQVDLARGLIYENGYVVNSVLVERILKNQSLTPTVVSANELYFVIAEADI
jgi:hypothetical protein